MNTGVRSVPRGRSAARPTEGPLDPVTERLGGRLIGRSGPDDGDQRGRRLDPFSHEARNVRAVLSPGCLNPSTAPCPCAPRRGDMSMREETVSWQRSSLVVEEVVTRAGPTCARRSIPCSVVPEQPLAAKSSSAAAVILVLALVGPGRRPRLREIPFSGAPAQLPMPSPCANQATVSSWERPTTSSRDRSGRSLWHGLVEPLMATGRPVPQSHRGGHGSPRSPCRRCGRGNCGHRAAEPLG